MTAGHIPSASKRAGHTVHNLRPPSAEPRRHTRAQVPRSLETSRAASQTRGESAEDALDSSSSKAMSSSDSAEAAAGEPVAPSRGSLTSPRDCKSLPEGNESFANRSKHCVNVCETNSGSRALIRNRSSFPDLHPVLRAAIRRSLRRRFARPRPHTPRRTSLHRALPETAI